MQQKQMIKHEAKVGKNNSKMNFFASGLIRVFFSVVQMGQATTATVEVGRVTAQGPGDASQVEHVTLKKKPKCKCCVLQ